MVKLGTKLKSFYRRNTLISIAIVGGAIWYYTKRPTPSLAPEANRASTSMMPTSVYAYDSYPAIRNEPYTDSSHMFGPADMDPVFYGF
ncbi:MAG: hypothetical protein VX199_07905 [Chloroflexota bacterium]|nr:hypothetical protein [Chloroflexota bacterium]|tara:strand:+ start:107 stop:370 length:264 start_codon:yes stop_codon:yes gene_type:complete